MHHHRHRSRHRHHCFHQPLPLLSLSVVVALGPCASGEAIDSPGMSATGLRYSRDGCAIVATFTVHGVFLFDTVHATPPRRFEAPPAPVPAPVPAPASASTAAEGPGERSLRMCV
jgi:hypothetical protein